MTAMDNILLRKAAVQSVALMIAVVTLSYALKHYQVITITAGSLFIDGTVSTEAATEDVIISLENELGDNNAPAVQTSMKEEMEPILDAEDLRSRIDRNILAKLGDNFLAIHKPEGDSISIRLEDKYVTHSIQLNLDGVTGKDMDNRSIYRIRGNRLFAGDPEYTEITAWEVDEDTGDMVDVVTKSFGEDISHGITITTAPAAQSGFYTTQILLVLDTVYAYIIYEDKDYYYIDLRKPSEVYDKIIVIDAGHGGKDAGALSMDDKLYEKDINLDIVLQLKELLDTQEDIKVYYTRTTDNTVYLRPRVTLANALDCDYFISIHCNAYPGTAPNGNEVLYYDTEYKGVKAAKLASICSDELSKTVALRSRGIVKKRMKDIFIMDEAQVPMVLIEAGFMTNKKDLAYLTDGESRKNIAKGIYNAILRAYEELPAAALRTGGSR